MISDGRDGAPRRPRPRFPRLGGRNECGCANAFRRSGEAAPDAVARRCGRRSAPSPPKMVRTKKVGTLRCDVPAGASRFSASGIFGLPAGDRKARAGGRRGAPSLPKRGRDNRAAMSPLAQSPYCQRKLSGGRQECAGQRTARRTVPTQYDMGKTPDCLFPAARGVFLGGKHGYIPVTNRWKRECGARNGACGMAANFV